MMMRSSLLSVLSLSASVLLGACEQPPHSQSKASQGTEPPPTVGIDGGPHAAPPQLKRLTGKLDVTFLVASDTHLGYGAPSSSARDALKEPNRIEKTNLRMIDSMNGIAGRPLPATIGGTVQKPRGVLISGDLTEHGGKDEWQLFTQFYGLKGTEGPLQIPVFEGAGNHDRVKNWHIREQVAKRHGGRHYYFDWDDLRVVCLGEAPDEAALKVLQEAFDTAASDVPFVLYFHHPLAGPYSDNNWFGRGDYRDRFGEAIRGRRVIAIFHGHYHATSAYRWHDVDVYNVGSPKYLHHSYSIVHVTQDSLTVAEWNYDKENYSWWHRKSLSDPNAEQIVGKDAHLEPPAIVGLGSTNPVVTRK